MATFVPVPNAAQFQMQYSQHDGSFAENSYWVQRDEAWDIAGLNTVAAAFKAWFDVGDGTSAPKASLTNHVSLQAVAGRDHTTEGSPAVVYTTGLPEAGANSAGTDVPLGFTWAITARTGLAGRSHRGRSYIIGLVAGDFASEPDNLMSAAAATLWTNIYNALAATIHTADAHSTLVVCSRYHGVDGTTGKPIPRAAGVTTPIASWGFHDLYADFQRRRSPAHNRHH